jgi:hypothetical protein
VLEVARGVYMCHQNACSATFRIRLSLLLAYPALSSQLLGLLDRVGQAVCWRRHFHFGRETAIPESRMTIVLWGEIPRVLVFQPPSCHSSKLSR